MLLRSGAAPEVLARTLTSACVGSGTLTAHRKVPAMTETTVTTEIHQALDGLLHFAASVAFDLDRSVNRVADGFDVGFAQLVDLARLGDVRRLADGSRRGGADTVDVRQGECDCLAAGEINSSNTGHVLLTLTLLVTRVVADDAQHTAALHDFALLADFLDAGTDLHDVPQIVSVI